MEEIKIKACGKINFFLDITGTEGGYHLIDTVMCSVDIGDIITVKKNNSGNINICCKGIENKNNTALIAAKLFWQKYSVCGFDIDIQKNIPVCSGLGGSSADAAGVLYALSKLFGKDTGGLTDICNRCGSDTLYMLNGGYARATGRGDIIHPFKCPQIYDLVIAKPKGGVSSAEAYREYDKQIINRANINSLNSNLYYENENTEENAQIIMKALTQKDLYNLARYCRNALFEASCSILPQIKDVINILKNYTPVAHMTGSGSACAGLFKSRSDALKCKEKLIQKGYYAVHAKTVDRGIIIQ